MAKRRYDHEHQYLKLSNGTSYKCTVEGCSHVLHGGLDYIVGRKAACPYCRGTYIITSQHCERKTLHCMKCTKDGKPITTVEELFKNTSSNETDAIGELLKERGIE